MMTTALWIALGVLLVAVVAWRLRRAARTLERILGDLPPNNGPSAEPDLGEDTPIAQTSQRDRQINQG